MRRPASPTKPRRTRSDSFAAPVAGWIANQNLAKPDPRAGQGAFTLDNFFPTATGARMRGGSQRYATIGGADLPVASMFSYADGNNRALFAALPTDIYDITTIADPLVSPAAEVTGQTSGDWVSVQFATAAGSFLRLVNGVDTPLVYDGVTFDTAPAITGAIPEDFSYVWAFKNRLFFIEKESLDAWYLPVDLIGGAATIFPMGGVFSLGGSLLFGATWSLDTGNGLAEQCIFVTTEGEVAVYQGTNPGDAAQWSKVGVYKIGRPLGAKAHMPAGGDIIIATDIGFIPLSQAIRRDVAALGPAAVSYPIETAWNEAVSGRRFAPWHCEIWPTNQMVMISLPVNDEQPSAMFVANARTGAWCRYTGWTGTCLEVFGDRAFFGSTNGRIIEAEVTGSDDGLPYTAVYVPLFEDLRSPASLKTVSMARAGYLAVNEMDARLSAQFDYTLELPIQPDAATTLADSLWGAGIWGESAWGEPTTKQMFQEWQSVAGVGYAVSVAVQITSGAVAPPFVDLVRIDFTYETADIVS